MSEFWPQLPPVINATCVALFTLLWQTSGATLLALLYRRLGLQGTLAFLAGWITWPPIAGITMIALTMVGLIFKPLLIGLALTVMACGLRLFWRNRLAFFALLRPFASSSPKWPAFVAAILMAIVFAYAAHPQRLYDQLSYHLVVAKRLLVTKSLGLNAYDSHLLIAGPLEFAFTWMRVLVPNDLFQIAAAQSWVFLAGGVGAIGILLTWPHLPLPYRILAAACVVFGFIPNNEMIRIAKPGAIMLAGTLLMLRIVLTPSLPTALILAGLAFIFMATNMTFIHAALAFGLMLIASKTKVVFERRALTFALLALGGFMLVLAKNYITMGHLLYPADTRFFTSSYADQFTADFWRQVSFSGDQSFLARYSGPFIVLSRSPNLVVWVILMSAFSVYATWKKAPAPAPGLNLKPVCLFILTFVAIWPIFYDGYIYTRFVTPFIAAVLLGGWLVVNRLTGPKGMLALAMTIILGAAGANLDVMLQKMARWHHNSTLESFRKEYPSLSAIEVVNKLVKPEDTVLFDDNWKYFFEANVLHSILTPRERAIWAELLEQPQQTAEKYRISALIMGVEGSAKRKNPDPREGPIGLVWEKLAPYGEIVVVGEEKILFSQCYFKKPCA